MRFLLVTGLVKSGTTWVQRILDAHPDIRCRPEDHFTRAWPAINRLVGDYNAYAGRTDDERDRQGIEPFDRTDARRLLFAFIRIALEKAPAGCLWSAIKDTELSGRGFLEAFELSRVLFVVRDPRDLIVSGWAHRQRVAPDAGASADAVPDWYVDELIGFWRRAALHTRKTTRDFPGRTALVRYEDLLTDFSPTVATLYRFLEVDSGTAATALAAEATDFRRLTGGRARGEADAASYFRRGVAGGWRRVLTEAQAARIGDAMAVEFRAFGYTPGG